jgi:tRNA nucleotidyltransferase (CCA-adding enzyme)
MDLVVSHDHSDFDALASQIAVTKLFPGAQIVITGSVGREVHPYLALHRDRFEFAAPDAVDWKAAKHIVLVDVRSESRLTHVNSHIRLARAAGARLIVFDHHGSRDDDLRGDVEVIEPLGSTTTILIERIADERIAIDPVEATLCALGIHTDTGSLTFANSTARDARALAWLMSRGAMLTVVNRYLHAPFSVRQRETIVRVLEVAEEHDFGGLRVGIALVETPRKLNGLDDVTSRALDTLGYHALFGVYSYTPGRIALIARARTRHVDVGELLARFGGGGHAGAASAIVRGESSDAVRQRLLAELRQHPPRAETVSDIMSSPVHSVAPELTIDELEGRLHEWGYTGVCVVGDDGLRGVISKRDVQRARAAGHAHLPVAGYMAHKLTTCAPNTPLDTALELAEQADVGRLPVLRDGCLVGIVSRSDLLRSLYGGPKAKRTTRDRQPR